MKKFIIIISLILFCTSCFVHKRESINGQCRPKNPNFKLEKIYFAETDKISFKRIYIADNVTKAVGYGFYPDGRIIYVHSKDGLALKPDEMYGKTWENAPAIGYWRVDGNIIKTEYFSCSNSGNYIEKQGSIKGDTIFFERDCGSKPFNKEKCIDRYILSDMYF